MTDELEPTAPRRPTPDPDLLNQGSGETEPPDGPLPDESTDDLLNRGSGENEPDRPENEPPIERKDGQVYGG